MNITYLIGAVFLVMISALVGTFVIGFSRGNKTETSGYGQGTGKKWTRLGFIYVLCIVIIIVIFVFLQKG